MRKPKQNKVPKNETKEAKFARLAQSRGKKLKDTMKLLSNLGPSSNYKIDASLAEELLVQFEESLNDLKASWTESLAKQKMRKEKTENKEKTVEDDTVEADVEETKAVETSSTN